MGYKSDCMHIDVVLPSKEINVLREAKKLGSIEVIEGLTGLLPKGVLEQPFNLRSTSRLNLYGKEEQQLLVELQRYCLKAGHILKFEYKDKVHHSWKVPGYTEVSVQCIRGSNTDKFYRIADLKEHRDYIVLPQLTKTDFLLSDYSSKRVKLPSSSGVYIAYRPGEPYPRYVGQSISLKTRLGTNRTIKELNKKYDDVRISVLTGEAIRGATQRVHFESQLRLFETLIAEECCCPYHANGQREYRDLYWHLYELAISRPN